MKQYLTLFAFTLLAHFGYSQGMVGTMAENLNVECEGQDITQHSELQTWLDDNTADILAGATSGCGGIPTVENDYEDGSGGFVLVETAPCLFELTVTWTVMDDCDPGTETTSATFTAEDLTAPEFVGVDGTVITVECDGLGNDVATIVSDFLGTLDGSNIMESCDDPNNLVASINFTPDPVPDGSEFDCDESIFVDFDLMDACGNPAQTATIEIIIEDTTPPMISGGIPDITLECSDPANDIQAYIDTEALNLISSGAVTEACSLSDVTVTGDDWSGTEPDCDNSETITVTFADLCGNEGTTSFSVTIEDNLPPTISMATSLGPFECDAATNSSVAADAINLAFTQATLDDPNGCTLSEDLAASVIFNPNPIPAEPTAVGACDYEYLVDITVEDDCGNVSAVTTVTVSFQDMTPPTTEFMSTTLNINCLSELGGAPPPLDVVDDCEGTISIVPTEDASGVICESDGVIIYTYDIEDECGNVSPDSPVTLTINIAPDPADVLQWIDPDDNLPGDISLTLNQVECMEEFSFPGCVWLEDPTDENSTSWPFPLSAGVHYEDPCGTAVFTSTHTPCPIFPGGGDIVVMYTLDDGCGNVLTHEFTIDITCANCDGGNGIFCGICDDAQPEGCFTCNVNDLLQGFSSCNPPYDGMIQGPPQPGSLCNGQGVPNNMSWFAFVAGSESISVSVCPSECIPSGGTTGIQAGIYDDCDGECIAGDGGCPNTLRCIDFSLNDLIVGKTYYLFVDGCNGAECQYDITISGQDGYILDDMEEVVAEVDCESPVPDKYCPGQTIRFNVNHDGATGNFGPGGGPYDEEADLCFEWSFSPELDGVSNEIYNQLEEGFVTPDFTLPTVTSETVITVCIEDVFGPCEDQCDDADCVSGDCCIDIVVAPLPDEVCVMDVCIEQLTSADGFDPSSAFEALCGGGVAGWLGATNITLADVDNNDTLVYQVVDPDCNCEFEQKLKINVVGSREKELHTWYMYECQFKEDIELNADIESFEWVTPRTGQEVEIESDFRDECITLFMYSQLTDWSSNNCDSIIQLTVEPLEVFAELTAGPCTSSGTQYFWELLIDDIDQDWPEIDPNYIVEWVRCDDVDDVSQMGTTQNPNDPFNVTAATEGEYCVRVQYQFSNFDFPVGSPLLTGFCEEVFGPYNLESDQASPPIIEGDTEFCANDLVGKTFTVAGATSSDIITWNTAGTGATIISENPPQITLDLTNFDFSQTILVQAQTACGNAEATLALSTIPVPVPAIDVTQEVCIGETVTANEINFGANNPLITEYIWTPMNNNSGGPVNFTAQAVGTQDIFLTVIDANGCMSDPVSASYEVIEPLEAPMVQCGSVTVSSVEFTWGSVDNATGYSIFVITPDNPAGTTLMVDNTVLSYEETGLLIDQTVSITVTALGPPPCGDSAPSNVRECTTQDCPDQLTVFMDGSGSICEGVTGQTFDFDLNATILDPDGVFTTSVDPAGSYYDQTTGIVNPDGLTPGTYTISSSYNYNGGQCPRQGPIFVLTVNPAPETDFTLSALELCVGDTITIDDSNVTPVAQFDFGMDGSRDNNNNLTWSSPGVKTVSVNVTTIDGCIGSSEQMVNVQDSIILGSITCPSAGLDFVTFEWDDVDNAADYSVTYTINNVSVDTTVSESMINLTGLANGVIVQVVVTANPEAGFCDTGSQMGICETSNCPTIDFTSNPGPFCFGAGDGPIDLELVITDPATGDDITALGTLEWLDPRVDNTTGLFSPGTSISTNETYTLSFLYTDQNGCPTQRSVDVEVLAQPEPVIAPIDAFCVDGNGVVELVGTFDNGEDIVWEWDGGSATGPGPHDITFSQGNAQYEVTVTVTNGADANGMVCEGVATQMVIVDPLLEAPVFTNCMANNTGVTFGWGPVANSAGYEVYIGGALESTQDSTSFFVSAVPGETVDIEVVALSGNNCPDVSATDSCTATDCPPSMIVMSAPVEMCLDGSEMPVQFDAVFDTNTPAPPGNPLAPGAWTGDGVTSDGLFDPAGLAAGTYTLEYVVEYDQDCDYFTTAFVTLFDAPQITNVMPVNPDCYLDNEGSIVMVAEGGTPPYSYQVNNLPEQSDGEFSPLNPGFYNVTVTDANGCMSDEQFEIVPAIEPDPSIGGPATITPGSSGVYTIENFPGDFEIGDVIWTATPLDGGDAIIICEGPDCDPVEIDLAEYPTLAGGFDLVVTIIFSNDCFIDADTRVDVISNPIYYIPNVFSNNSTDELNQSWSMFVSSGEIVVNSVGVYDRWGELVHFKDSDLLPDANNRIDLGWAGEWTNDDIADRPNVEQGVYVYIIKLTDEDGRDVTEAGDVTVLR